MLSNVVTTMDAVIFSIPYTTSGLKDFEYGAHTCNDNAECSNIPGN